MKRTETRAVKIKDLTIGASNEVVIQSMCTYKTSKIKKVINQINLCKKAGAKIMRVSILDRRDLNALKIIVNSVDLPLVADIHFSLNYALTAIKNGAHGIRINPGNIDINSKTLKEILSLAKQKNTCIRIGVNKGSINLNNLSFDDEVDLLIKKTNEYISFFESNNFYNFVISIKDSNPLITLKAYRIISNLTNAPLHIGVTESGFDEVGIIRSLSVLSPLLLEGIGSTIRISLTNNPIKEIITAKRLLHDLGLYKDYPTIISCPTCGRTFTKNLDKLAKKVLLFLEENNINIKVAIMGCNVNGINEAKDALVGLAGTKNGYILFKNGNIIKNVSNSEAYDVLINEIKLLNK